MEGLIRKFNSIGIADVSVVGGKNSSLGEMFTQLSVRGIKVPDGFATTALAFDNYLDYNKLKQPLALLMQGLNRNDYSNLNEIGCKARELILQAKLPESLVTAIIESYSELC